MNPEEHLIVRCENIQTAEPSVVHSINLAAFGRADEADLVDSLRLEGAVILSLVAEWEKRIVGHILFSRMWIDTANGSIPAVALAPMAVLPECQRRGIGGQLVRHGLDLLRERGERIVIVLGHPDFLSALWILYREGALSRKPVSSRCIHGARTKLRRARGDSRAGQISGSLPTPGVNLKSDCE